MPEVKKTFRISVRIKGTDKVFDVDLGPGVIGAQDIVLSGAERDFEGPMFIQTLMAAEEEFLKDLVETTVEEIDNNANILPQEGS